MLTDRFYGNCECKKYNKLRCKTVEKRQSYSLRWCGSHIKCPSPENTRFVSTAMSGQLENID